MIRLFMARRTNAHRALQYLPFFVYKKKDRPIEPEAVSHGDCRALAANDAVELEGSLRALLDDNERQAMELADPEAGSVLSSDYPFFPVEGLALLAAAERRGMSVAFEVEGCPRLVRSPGTLAFRPLAYPNQSLD